MQKLGSQKSIPPLTKKDSFKEDKSNPIVSKLLGSNPNEINIEKFRERKSVTSQTFVFKTNGKLTKNILKSISGKFTLECIFVLDLSNQSLSSLVHIDECKNLLFLNLSNNLLSDLKGIEKLDQLIYLNVEKNSLSTIDPISALSSLQFLILNGNMIKSTILLNCLVDLRFLRTLFLQTLRGEMKNPACDEVDYRNIVFNTLKSLKRLDGLPKDMKKMDFGDDIKTVREFKFDFKTSTDYWYTPNFPKVEPVKMNSFQSENGLSVELKKCREIMEKCEEKLLGLLKS